MAISVKMRLTERIYFTPVVVLAVVGLLSPFSYNALPASSILEITFFLSAASVLRLPKPDVIPFLLASVLYVLGSYVLMREFMPSNALDFLQAFKAFIYVIPLCFFHRRNVLGRDRALNFLKIILVAFFVKYSYSLALNLNPRMGSRPGLFTENNFELIFLLLYFYLLATDFGKNLNRWFALLAVVVLMSGSRSSALALVIVFAGLYIRNFNLRTFFYLFFFVLITAAAAGTFVARGAGGGIESIDRYKFMLVFLDEVRNWAWWDFILGSFPITALSPQSCQSLSFYKSLFSFSQDDSCYSVILHSYFLRVIFDHGFAGLSFLFGFISFALHRAGYSRRDIFVFLLVLSASALSVSAMNSIFVSLAIALALGLRRTAGNENYLTTKVTATH